MKSEEEVRERLEELQGHKASPGIGLTLNGQTERDILKWVLEDNE